MATLQRELFDAGAPAAFGSGTQQPQQQPAAIPKSASEAAMNADIRLRTRFDMDNVQVPRAELSSMVFFERRRRDEGEKGYLLKTRIFDDPTIIPNKPYQLYPTTYRFPMQCTRLAFVAPKNNNGVIDLNGPPQLGPPQPAAPGGLPFLTGSKPNKV